MALTDGPSVRADPKSLIGNIAFDSNEVNRATDSRAFQFPSILVERRPANYQTPVFR